MFKHSPRGDPTLVRLNRNRRAVAVAPAHHKNMVASKTMITGEYVRRQIRPCKVSDVHIPICIGPRYRNMDKLVHSGSVLPLCYILPLRVGLLSQIKKPPATADGQEFENQGTTTHTLHHQSTLCLGDGIRHSIKAEGSKQIVYHACQYIGFCMNWQMIISQSSTIQGHYGYLIDTTL